MAPDELKTKPLEELLAEIADSFPEQAQQLAGHLQKSEMQRLQAEEELALARQNNTKIRQQHSFLREILDTTPDFLFVKDHLGRLVFCNQKFASIFDKKPKDILGQTAFDLFPDPAIGEKMHQCDEEIFSGRTNIMDYEEQYTDGQGHLKWAHTIKMKMSEAPSSHPLIVGVSQDISDKKEAEHALRETEERFELFMANISAAIFIIDQDQHILFANHSFSNLCTVRDWHGKTIHEILPASVAANFERQNRVAMKKAALLSSEMFPNQSGVARQYEVHRFVINRPDDTPLLGGIALDVTSLKQAEEERSRLEEQLLQALKMEAIGHLAGGVAHDFNNLLSPILGYADLLLMQLQPDDPMAKDIRQIHDAAERGASLTQQLLAFGRKQVLDVKTISLNTVIADFARMLRRVIGEDIILATSLEPDLGSVKADLPQIQQIVMNLVINARDAMPKGGTLIIETSELFLDEKFVQSYPGAKAGSYVCLTVGDTGVGMTTEVMNHMFEPFFTTKDQGKGTGLGLSSVYGLVKQHGGLIAAESQPGNGSTFRIYFPRVESSNLDNIAQRSSRALGGNETILVVEDEEVVRDLAADVLRSYGYNVLTAGNAHEAMTLQAEFDKTIHLLLIDIVMPGKDGREFFEEISILRPGTSAIFMSGYMEELENSVHQFLQKPFSVIHLLQTVRQVLDESIGTTLH